MGGLIKQFQFASLISDNYEENNCVPAINSFACYQCKTTTSGGNDGYIIAFNYMNYIRQIFIDTDDTLIISARQRSNTGKWGLWKRFQLIE